MIRHDSPVDLKSGYPYWAVKNNLMYAIPRLDAGLSCDVAVVGAGITGALLADELAGHGHDFVVLDQRDVCWGSTSASTALLQYEIDTHATDLVKRYDQASAPGRRICLAETARLSGSLAEPRRRICICAALSDSVYLDNCHLHPIGGVCDVID
jgi:hypothetical protein